MSDTSKKKKIKIGPVRFKHAEDQPHSVGNKDFRLFPHQAKFFENLTEVLADGQSKFFFLESMTGSGKTIANITPAIERGDNILITYPTNQLIKDQKTSIDEDTNKFSFNARIEIISSKKLRSEGQEADRSIVEILDKKFSNAQNDSVSHIFLTTPDTLYNILTGKYWGSSGFDQPMKRVQTNLLATISYLVFDEFHMYDVSMETSILNMCTILHHNIGKSLPIVFSSATSDEEFKENLSNASRDSIVDIDDQSSISENGSHTICGEIELEIMLGNKWNGPEIFEKRKEDEIIDAVSGNGEKLTAIFESVKRTTNLISSLKKNIPQVEGVWAYKTGIDSNGISVKESPLVIGTRTLSVGIDFDTRNLFFESYRARDFLQKLGRVGRQEDNKISQATCYTSEYSFPQLDEIEEYYENKKKLKHDLIGKNDQDGKMAEQGKMWGYSEDYGPIELNNMWNDFPVNIDEGNLIGMSHEVYGKSPYYDESRPWLDDFLMAFRDPGVPQVAVGKKEDGIQLQEVMMFLEQRSSDLREHKDNLTTKNKFLEKYSTTSPVVAEYIENKTIEPILFYQTPPQKDASGTIDLRVTSEVSKKGLMRYPTDTDFRMKISGSDLPGVLTREIADRMLDRELLIFLIQEERFKNLPLPHLFKTYELEAARGERYRVAFGQNALKLDAHEKRCKD